MMRFSFPLLLILLSLSFPSVGETMYDLVIREGIHYMKFSDVPFTGKVDGQQQGSFKNGLREGTFVRYYKNGQLDYKGNYKDGKQEGPWVSNNKDGTVWSNLTGTFRNGVKISD